jgi:hypothetical protein
MRSPRQRRVPRALVHRGRPRGWAHVTCGGNGHHHNRSPGGRGRRQPHTRPTRTHRLPSPTNETRGARRPTRQPRASAAPAVAALAGDNDAPRRPGCAAGAARALPGCGWQRVRRCGGGVRQRCVQTARGGGWRRPRPPGLRLAAGSAVRWWRGATMRPSGTSVRLAPPAPSRAAVVMVPIATTSYERPAPWPLTMHKCARDPALR